jgi:FMN-dependent NADH-azoreductase
MSKLLYIKANPKSDENSRTFKISNHFVEKYKQYNPQDEVITLDLYKEDIRFLSERGIQLKFNTSERDDPFLRYANQFADADKYVFAEPLWNLGVPAILKAYVDYICIVGVTFQYTARGPVGLSKDKKAVNITTRGGQYSEGPGANLEMGDRYLKNLLGFLGVTDFSTIAADMLDVVGMDVAAIMSKALQQAEWLAQSF